MEIKNKPEFKIVGMKKVTTLNKCSKELPLLWQEFMKREKEIKNADKSKSLGIGYAEKQDINMEDCYNEPYAYVACFEVKKTTKIPEGMISKTIPALKYAVFQHKGKLSGLWSAYENIYFKELPKTNLKTHKEGYGIEVYPKDWDPDSDNSVMEIWIAVE